MAGETNTSPVLAAADRAAGGAVTDIAKMTPQQRHSRLIAWFDQEMRRQAHNRFQMAMDEDYYDSIQWQPDEAAEVKARGQSPVVYNEVKPMIDWLIGIERRTRVDFKVYSRDDSPGADEDAKNKTKLLKYLSDVNREPFERSRAADDQFKAGLGWIEIGISPDPEDEPIYKRAESWRNCLYDSLGTSRDINQDCRYFFRFRIVDLDVAIAYFPDKEAQLRAACIGHSDEHYLEWWNGKRIEEVDAPIGMPGKYSMFDSDAWVNNVRDRVLLIECWHYEYTRETRGGTSIVDRVRKKMHCTLMTRQDEILHVPSPYRHNKFPFVPYWCYRRKRDNAPYSPIRPVRGPQDSMNKRVSKALFELSANQVIAEEDALNPAVMDADEVREELQAPDGFAVLAKGGLKKLEVRKGNPNFQGLLELAQLDQSMIRNASGVSDQNLNRTENQQSGIALKMKDDQGSKLTAEIFDNMLFAHQLEGEIELSLAEQFYTEPKVFPVAGERGKREYVRINQPGPNGERLNDITQRKAQFVIGEQAWRQTLMQAAFESMMELLGQLAPVAPQVVLALMDMVFELADIPNKQTVVQRIRSVTGFNDPDEPMTPEQQADAQQKQRQATLQAQLQMRQLMNDIKAAEAKGEQLSAQTLKTRVEAMYVAMQAGQVVATVPHVTPVADELLASAGFKDMHPGAAAPAVVQDPNLAPGATSQPPAPDSGMPPADQVPAAQPALAAGEEQGIETVRPDGATQPTGAPQ